MKQNRVQCHFHHRGRVGRLGLSYIFHVARDDTRSVSCSIVWYSDGRCRVSVTPSVNIARKQCPAAATLIEWRFCDFELIYQLNDALNPLIRLDSLKKW